MRIQTGLIGAVVLFTGLFAIGRAVAKWLGPADEVTRKKQLVVIKLYLLVLVVVMVGVPVLFRAVPVGDALLPSGPPLAAVMLDSGFAATVAGLGFAGAWLGLRPFRTTRQWLDGELRQQFLRARTYKIGVTVLVAVVIELATLFSVSALGLLFLGLTLAIGGTFIGDYLAFSVHAPDVGYGVRRPTEEERDRIEHIYERLDIPLPDRIEVGVNDPTEKIAVLRTADQRVLALSDSVFSDFDSDIQSVKVAHAEGRAKHGVDSFQSTFHWVRLCGLVAGVWAVFFIIWGFFVAGRSSSVFIYGPVLPAATILAIMAELLSQGNERVHMADEYTVEHADPSVVTDVYEDPEVRDGVIADEQSRNDGFKLALELPIADRLEHVGLTDTGNSQPSNLHGEKQDSTE